MGGSVNQGAQQAEQQNQVKAQQYAAQQQQAALGAVNSWTAANKPPGQSAAPLQAPQAQSPATFGGGVASGGQMPPQSRGQRQPPPSQQPPMPGQPAQAPPPGVTLNPQQRAHLLALVGGQGGM